MRSPQAKVTSDERACLCFPAIPDHLPGAANGQLDLGTHVVGDSEPNTWGCSPGLMEIGLFL